MREVKFVSVFVLLALLVSAGVGVAAAQDPPPPGVEVKDEQLPEGVELTPLTAPYNPTAKPSDFASDFEGGVAPTSWWPSVNARWNSSVPHDVPVNSWWTYDGEVSYDVGSIDILPLPARVRYHAYLNTYIWQTIYTTGGNVSVNIYYADGWKHYDTYDRIIMGSVDWYRDFNTQARSTPSGGADYNLMYGDLGCCWSDEATMWTKVVP